MLKAPIARLSGCRRAREVSPRSLAPGAAQIGELSGLPRSLGLGTVEARNDKARGLDGSRASVWLRVIGGGLAAVALAAVAAADRVAVEVTRAAGALDDRHLLDRLTLGGPGPGSHLGPAVRRGRGKR